MRVYEYRYVRPDGTEVIVEKRGVPMSAASEPIEVVDEVDGKTYMAERIISPTSRMALSWNSSVNNSDLPPVDASPEDVQKGFAG